MSQAPAGTGGRTMNTVHHAAARNSKPMTPCRIGTTDFGSLAANAPPDSTGSVSALTGPGTAAPRPSSVALRDDVPFPISPIANSDRPARKPSRSSVLRWHRRCIHLQPLDFLRLIMIHAESLNG